MTTARKNLFAACAFSAMLCLALAGCKGEDDTTTSTPPDTTTATTSAIDRVMLTRAPENPRPISELRQSAKEGDEVVIRVIVGGRENPIVANRAVMTVVDASLPNNCTTEEDHCATPWDYCCEGVEQLQENMATVQIVDAEGRPLEAQLEQASIKPLTTLVIKGTVANGADQETLIVNAEGIYVESSS